MFSICITFVNAIIASLTHNYGFFFKFKNITFFLFFVFYNVKIKTVLQLFYLKSPNINK